MSSCYQLKNIHQAVIVGAGHGIGCALTQQLLQHHPECHIYASYRQAKLAAPLQALQQQYPERLKTYALDPLQEPALAQWFEHLQTLTPQLDLLINCVGVLHHAKVQPEKSLNQIQLSTLTHYFQVNAILTPLLAKYAFPLLRQADLAAFASISAKVGSIGDNRMGGWYGYRASKAALNMFLRNIAIEFRHRNCPCIALAIHPGTTKTMLSAPYTKHTRLPLHDTAATARHILAVIDGKCLDDSGQFYNWDGTLLPW
ncbi:MAG: SDR family NAD(P)-dependent oxidoreductase [Zetaproteobacteria bacterium]|nr:SDR family NAD(P)-dependent oxidoreductase [Zetaproteobacteria bacterium]